MFHVSKRGVYNIFFVLFCFWYNAFVFFVCSLLPCDSFLKFQVSRVVFPYLYKFVLNVFCFVHFYKLHNYNFTLKMLLFHFHFFLLVFECFCFLCVIVCLRQSLLVLHAIRLFSKIQNKRTLNVSMISRLVWL